MLAMGIVFMSSQCSPTHLSIDDIPQTDFFDSCSAGPEIYFGQEVSIGDPGERFLISLPYSWDIRESYSDTLYGIFGSNFMTSEKKDTEKMSLGIMAYASDLSLKDYYTNELQSLLDDKQTQVLETGSTSVQQKNAYWVKFKSTYPEKEVYQLVLYLKNRNKPEIYLVQATAYSADKYEYILCNLKLFMQQIEIN